LIRMKRIFRISRISRIALRGVKARPTGPGFFGNCRSGWQCFANCSVTLLRHSELPMQTTKRKEPLAQGTLSASVIDPINEKNPL
jgi:hypothetical protein